VTFEEAATVSAEPLALVVVDETHAERALVVGESALRRVLVTVFAERGNAEIRIISARCATNHERRRHEEGR
jgi:uncharacterized DUF497 family protein